MTATCRSEIVQLLEIAIRSLEETFHGYLGDDYQEDLCAMCAIDYLTDLKNTINPPFLSQDIQGNMVVSDMLTDHSEDIESLKGIITIMMARLMELEKRIKNEE